MLGWLNESSSDIVIANDAEIEGHIGLFCVTNGRGYTGIGNRDNDIGVQVTFPSQLCADLLSDVINVTAFQHAVGPGEVYVFKNTEFLRALVEGLDAMQAFFVDDDDFTRFYIANELRSDDIQGACLGRQDRRVAKAA